MDSSPPDRATLHQFFGFTNGDRATVGRSSGQTGQPPDAQRSAMPTIRSPQQQQQPQQDILAYWKNWENEVVLGAVESTGLPKEEPEDESFLGGDFSLSELLNTLPSDRLENAPCDLRDLPPLAAACVSPGAGPGVVLGARAHAVNRLLADGADPRERDPVFRRNPLHWACLHADLDVIRLLVGALKRTAGAMSEINDPDVNGLTPLLAVLALRAANLREHAEIIDYLLEQGADLGSLPWQGAELLFADFLTVDIARRVLADD